MQNSSNGIWNVSRGIASNIADPKTYTDDFSSDKGYFSEDNGEHNWKIENGVYTCTAPDKEPIVTRLHIWEHNVHMKARIRRVGDNPAYSGFGFLFRNCAENGFVRVSHRPLYGMFTIDSRDCEDYPAERLAEIKHPMEKDKWYDFEITVDGRTCEVKLDGEPLISTDKLDNLSPGKVGIFVENTSVEVDHVEYTFLSGQGVLWKDIKHNILPDEVYREGGSVTERLDGTLTYLDHRGACFESKDNGETWQRQDIGVKLYGYNSILRLNSGKLIMTGTTEVEGVKYNCAYVSCDDGATWREAGIITESRHLGHPDHVAGNMNDKLNQAASGRIFYSQNYECKHRNFYDGMHVFCKFFYSDDEGETWIQSETPSWELGDNKVENFGECKLLECADGTVRVYSSWHRYGTIMYAESKDGGKTFGELQRLEGFPSAHSSMQFVRDPYADNDTTYYMVWVNCTPKERFNDRSRLSLAKTTNGKDWQFLGDFWRNEVRYAPGGANPICHLVDPFVKVTKTHVIAGSGVSEKLDPKYGSHNAQRQHIWSVPKSELKPEKMMY